MKKLISLAMAAALASGAAFGAYAAETETEQNGAMETMLLSIFNSISELEEDTAGSSLDTAEIASELLAFAEEYDLTSENGKEERDKLVAAAISALMSMDMEKIAVIEEGYDKVGEIVDKAIENYDSVKDVFADAGISGAVDSLLAEGSAVSAYWQTVDESIDEAFDQVQEEMEEAQSELDALETEADMDFDLEDSEVFTEEDFDDAVAKIQEEFDSWDCSDLDLKYMGDECNSKENLAWMNSLEDDEEFTDCMGFDSSFHSPEDPDEPSAWEADSDYEGWSWWLARNKDGEWKLVTWGY